MQRRSMVPQQYLYLLSPFKKSTYVTVLNLTFPSIQIFCELNILSIFEEEKSLPKGAKSLMQQMEQEEDLSATLQRIMPGSWLPLVIYFLGYNVL